MTSLRLSLVPLLLLLATPVSAQRHCSTADPEVQKRIDHVIAGLLPATAFQDRYGAPAKLTDRMAWYHTPGASVAVINNGQVEWACGFGVREQGKPAPVTPETLFQAASISKPVFALGVLRLVEQGRLGLDDDVNEHLKSWKIPPAGSWQPRITLRQILTHSAGLTVHGFPGYSAGERLPTVIDVLNGRPPANTRPVEVNVFPGVQSRYSGGGIMVAQLLVTDTLGQPFPQIMRELVLDPLGMKSSTYENPLPASRAAAAATAHPWKGRPLPGHWYNYAEMAAGGLWTTPSDLARVGIELQRTLHGAPPRLLKHETVEEMLKPQIPAEGGGEMGISFYLEGKDDDVRFGHGGWNEGFVAIAAFSKNHGQGAVIMLNSNEGDPLIDEILRGIAREYQWPGYFPPNPETVKIAGSAIDALAGDYETGSRLHFKVERQGENLLLTVGGQPPLALVPQSGTTFLLGPLNGKVTFEKDAEGRGSRLTLEQGGAVTAERAGPVH